LAGRVAFAIPSLLAALSGCGYPSGPPPAPTSVGVNPARLILAVGQRRPLRAVATYSDGRRSAVTASWSSTNTNVATVSGGIVRGVSPGSAGLVAAFGEFSGAAEVEVASTTAPIGPLQISPRNPRYFQTATGRIVYLTGSHTWSNLRDNGTRDPPPAFDYPAYLDFLQAHGHNFFRLWAWEQQKWTQQLAGNYWFSPGPYARPGPGYAQDGKPRFDLTRFDDAYFERLRGRVQQAEARGIYVSVMLFDGWSVATKGTFTLDNPWRGHPFNVVNNTNGVDGDPNHDGLGLESHTLAVPTVVALQEAYVRRVVDAVNDLDNVLYEISNESDPGARQWQYHMIELVRRLERGKPKQHPIGMTAAWPNGSNSELTASPADWISPNGDLKDPPAADGAKVILNDTDHLCGICGSVAWVWKSFTRGLNPILMDGYDGTAVGLGAAGYVATDPMWPAIRRNLGYTQSYAVRMDLGAARPRGDLASSRYCLAKPGSEYLVFVPGGGTVTVDLGAAPGPFTIEWFDPATGTSIPGGQLAGGAASSLASPLRGEDAVLFLHH
jgi:hypothetical protein